MSYQNANLLLTRGNPVNIYIDVTENGAAVDLTTAATIVFNMSRRGSSPTVTKSLGSGVSLVAETPGRCSIVMTDDETTSLWGYYDHTLVVTIGDNSYTVSTGQIIIS